VKWYYPQLYTVNWTSGLEIYNVVFVYIICIDKILMQLVWRSQLIYSWGELENMEDCFRYDFHIFYDPILFYFEGQWVNLFVLSIA